MSTLSRADGHWTLHGRPLHCGDALLVAIEDGGWIPCRFELSWSRSGPRPVVHLPFLGAGPSVDAGRLSFRWPGGRA